MIFLSAYLQRDAETRYYQKYTATVLWSLGKMQAEDYPMPSYPDFSAKKKQEDTRTAEEMIGDMLKRAKKIAGKEDKT